MLGLAEKNILNYEFDMVASDPSDANTNSTTLFSDDTDDKSRRSTNPDMAIAATHQEDESGIAAALVEPPAVHTVKHQPDVPGISERRTGQPSSCPRKSELKIGESSAFFTYVKSRAVKNKAVDVEDNAKRLLLDENHQETSHRAAHLPPIQENGEALESHSQGDEFPSSSFPDSFSVERSCTPPAGTEVHRERNINEENCSQALVHPRDGSQVDMSGLPVQTQTAYPFYMPEGMMSAQLYQKNLHDMQNHAAMMSQYGHFHHCPPNVSGVASYPYYPMNICLQPGQMPTSTTHIHSWPSFGNSSSNEAKSNKFDRREAALIKFRQKRKERCFDKKIRYVNRKRLAERRPRVRGQFVRKVNGVNVDLNGQPASVDDVEDEDEEEELLSRDSSHEDDGSGY